MFGQNLKINIVKEFHPFSHLEYVTFICMTGVFRISEWVILSFHQLTPSQIFLLDNTFIRVCVCVCVHCSTIVNYPKWFKIPVNPWEVWCHSQMSENISNPLIVVWRIVKLGIAQILLWFGILGLKKNALFRMEWEQSVRKRRQFYPEQASGSIRPKFDKCELG